MSGICQGPGVSVEECVHKMNILVMPSLGKSPELTWDGWKMSQLIYCQAGCCICVPGFR